MLKYLAIFLMLCISSGSNAVQADISFKEIGSAKAKSEADAYIKRIRKEYIQNNKLDPKLPADKQLLSEEQKMKLQVAIRKDLLEYGFYGATRALEKILATGVRDYKTWALFAKSMSFFSEYSDTQKLFIACDRALKLATTDMEKAYIHYYIRRVFKDYQIPKELDSKVAQKTIDEFENSLIAEYPDKFGVYSLDVDAVSTPRVCINFSYALKTFEKIKPSDFIFISPKVKNKSVTAAGDKLCISGLDFDQEYSIKIKKGLESTSKNIIKEDFSTKVYIRDRPPLLSRNNDGYILPAYGPQVLPIISSNNNTVLAKISAIPEQAIHEFFSRYAGKLDSSWYYTDIAWNYLDEVWSGVVNVKDEINKIQSFAIPVSKMLKSSLKPGIYICEINEDRRVKNLKSITQWFMVTDIGLTFVSGEDGLHVIARSLHTGKPIPNLNVELFVRSGKPVALVKTNADGMVTFQKPLVSGKKANSPLYVLARTEKEDDASYGYINVEPFDLTDRGDKGRQLTEFYNAYVYTDRDIYRPGDDINLTVMLRDHECNAIESVPLTIVTKKNGYVEYEKFVSTNSELGVHTHIIKTSRNDGSGTWKILVYADPKAEPIATRDILVTDFMPATIEGSLESNAPIYLPNQKAEQTLKVKYLSGEPASELTVKSTIKLESASTPFEKWKNFSFGMATKPFTSVIVGELESITDSAGTTKLEFTLPDVKNKNSPVEVITKSTVNDISGRSKVISSSTPFWAGEYLIGIAKNFDDFAPYNGEAVFEIIAVNKDGQLLDKQNLQYKLIEEEVNYVWFKKSDHWKYEPVISDKEVQSGVVSSSSKKPTQIKVKIKSGQYRIEVKDIDKGIHSNVSFNAGWNFADQSKPKPDKVKVISDKKEYRLGEKAKLTITPPYDGELMVFTASNKLKLVHKGSISKSGVNIEIPVDAENFNYPGSYVYATVFRPGSKNHEVANRAIGLGWINLDSSVHKLDLDVKAPLHIRPKSTLDIQLSTKDNEQSAFLQVLAVDEGVLSVTGYKSPDPLGFFSSEYAFNYKVIDAYAKIIDSHGAKETSFNVGAGTYSIGNLSALQESSIKIVSLYSGVVKFNSDGTAKISLEVPEYTGKLRLITNAWSKSKLASKSTFVTVHDPMIVRIGAPRFLSLGDKSDCKILVSNVEAAEGESTINISANGAVGNVNKTFSASLKHGEKKLIPLALNPKATGEINIEVNVKDSEGKSYSRTQTIYVRSNEMETSIRKSYPVNPGKEFSMDSALTSELKDVNINLTVNAALPLSVKNISQDLMKYPMHCLEQTISRGYAMLAEKMDVRDVVEDILSLRSTGGGSFATWRNQADDYYLTGYAYEFLMEAGAKNSLSENILLSIKENVDSFVDDRIQLPVNVIAYYMYLISKYEKPNIGSLRYFIFSRKDMINTPSSQAYVAGAFAYLNQEKSSLEWFNVAVKTIEVLSKSHELRAKTLSNAVYDSFIFEISEVARIMLETTKNSPLLPKVLTVLAEQLEFKSSLSTLEMGSLVRVHELLKDQNKSFTINVEGEPKTISSSKSLMYNNARKIKNTGKDTIWVTADIRGFPKKPQVPKNSGFTVTRTILDAEGKAVKSTDLKLGENYAVVFKGTVKNLRNRNVVIVDYLPAGIEIKSSVLSEKISKKLREAIGVTNNLLGRGEGDDRFIAGFNLNENQNEFCVVYIATAVTAGSYSHPLPRIEDMYHPEDSSIGTADVKVVITK